MVYRAQLGAVNPADVFLPILIASYIGSVIALIAVAIVQRINLLDRVILAYLLGVSGFIIAVMYAFSQAPQEQIQVVSTVVANVALFGVIAVFILMAAVKRVNAYEAFIEGAKEGFAVAIRIIPYLVAILVAIGIFRASGALDLLVSGVARALGAIGLPTDWVPALPTALMKPLSGSGARGMMIDAMTTHGADSFVGRLVSTIQGGTDTTFYILALYFGSVGVRKTRHAVACGLFADFVGITAAIIVAYIFWG
jgi:spore maturation protein SpmB